MIITRNQFGTLLNDKNNHAITVLMGARQVGKSTLMDEIQAQLGTCRAINLENPLHMKIFRDGYTSFIQEVPEPVVFIDEFHYYPNITSVFKAIYDLNPEKKIYASGSSSLEMHQHLKESLAGRKKEYLIYPFSFSEWLQRTGESIPSFQDHIPIELKSQLDYRMKPFLTYGAMPGLTGLTDDLQYRDYLFNLYQTYIAKDIKTFLKESSIMAFNKVIEYLVIHNTGMLNLNELSTMSGISMRQVQQQIDVLVGTYVLRLLRPLFTNKGKELVKTPKIYFYDQGVANAIMSDFRSPDKRQDCGALYEQFVYWELEKSLDIRFTLHYWRTADQHEVDFVVVKDREYLPIEVKTSWQAGKIPPGLKAFLRYYPETRNAVVLSNCLADPVKLDHCTIHFHPWYRAHQVKQLLLDS